MVRILRTNEEFVISTDSFVQGIEQISRVQANPHVTVLFRFKWCVVKSRELWVMRPTVIGSTFPIVLVGLQSSFKDDLNASLGELVFKQCECRESGSPTLTFWTCSIRRRT